MAASEVERSLVYILIFIGEFFADSGISIDLVVGVLVTVSVLLLIALLVTCLITWKRKTDKLMDLLQFRSRPIHMPFRKNTNVRSTSELKESAKKKNLKKNLSKSTTNLNNNTENKGMSKSASCSALDLPLPSEPGCKKSGDKIKSSENLKPATRTTTIYDDDFQVSIMLKENAAYSDNLLKSVSVSAMVDKINMGPEQEQGHEYEQLEMVSIKNSK